MDVIHIVNDNATRAKEWELVYEEGRLAVRAAHERRAERLAEKHKQNILCVLAVFAGIATTAFFFGVMIIMLLIFQ